jgi:hypothetical protein
MKICLKDSEILTYLQSEQLCNTIPNWDILKTKIKQITNPQKEISEVFF